MTDATLARIEDHLRRIADALEGCAGDRACTTASHWAPFGRVNHGDAPTTCIYGQDHPDAVGCVYRCAATMPGHRCTRAEHSDDRHQWTMTDEEYDRRREEAGVPRDVFDDVRAWADGWEAKQQEAAQRRLTAGCGYCGGECGQLDGSGTAGLNLNVQTALAEIMTAIETGCDMVTYTLRPQSNAQQTVDAMHAAVALLRETVMRYTGPAVTVDVRSLETGEPVPVSVGVRKVEDPLDESDHRPRHDRDGVHWDFDGKWWSSPGMFNCDHRELDWDRGPLTFCDCDPTDSDRATD